MAWGEVRSGRSLDRLINFSDAVVAVAITILALPLVDIEGPADGESMLVVLDHNFGKIQTFVVTFIVVAILWSVHNRIVNNLGAYDTAIFWLVILWLLGFVFLPWPSSLYTAPGFRSEVSGEIVGDPWGAAVLYWLTLAYISLIGAMTARHMRRHPELIDPALRDYWNDYQSSRARWRGVGFTSIFVLAALVSGINFMLGYYMLFLMIPLSIFLKPPKAPRDTTDVSNAPGPS